MIAAYILADGESKRFSYQAKGMQILAGKPMIQHVIDRLLKQTLVNSITINSMLAEYAQFGYPCVGDITPYKGPLNGLYTCMQHMLNHQQDSEWLLLCPCDAPLLPLSFAKDLLSASQKNSALAVAYNYEKQLQPVFSLWHKSLLSNLQVAVEKHHWGGVKKFIYSISERVYLLDYKNTQSKPNGTHNPFMNINCANELALAEALIHPFNI